MKNLFGPNKELDAFGYRFRIRTDGQPDRVVPYHSRHISDARFGVLRGLCEDWLVENGILTSGQAPAARRYRLVDGVWDMIKEINPQDYHPLLFAYMMGTNDFHYNKLDPILKREEERDKSMCGRYLSCQNAFMEAAVKEYTNGNGDLTKPTTDQKIELLLTRISHPFRIYFMLKECALKNCPENTIAARFNRSLEFQLSQSMPLATR